MNSSYQQEPSSGALFPILLVLVCVGGLFLFAWFFRVPPPVGDVYEIQGREHIPEGSAHDPYNSNVPTSGPHYAKEADWGVYDQELPDEQLVHNLEHGGIWISYTKLSDDERRQLTALAKAYPQTVIMTPRAKNENRIVLASWGRLMKFDRIDEQKIRDFIRSNKNHSPEPLVP